VTDLHQWITQQVERVEEDARYSLSYGCMFFDTNDEYVVEHYMRAGSPEAILRRCEADRRILARHRMDPTMADSRLYATACDGCGTYGDCDDPVTENLNDCPELLDLAHAHGITDEILAGLDRPEPPPRRRRTSPRLGLSDILRDPTDVPPALRGPNWKENA
jgi:hypothetical protein